MFEKFGRTSTCFCGSGKKFKKCCERALKKEPKTLINAGGGNLQISGCDVELHTIYDLRLSDEIVKAVVKQVVDFYEKTYPNGERVGKIGEDFIMHPRLTVGFMITTIHPHHYSMWVGNEGAIRNLFKQYDALFDSHHQDQDLETPPDDSSPGIIISTKKPEQEPLTDKLIEELIGEGWGRGGLLMAQVQGMGYSRERNLMMHTVQIK